MPVVMEVMAVTTVVAPAEPAVFDGFDATAAYSASRVVITGYAGSFYTDAGAGEVSEFLDQTGNTRDFIQTTAADRPTATTAGGNSIAALDFDATNTEHMNSLFTLDDIINAGTGYAVWSFIVNTFFNAGAPPGEAAIWSSYGAYAGISNNDESGGKIGAWNHDGGYDVIYDDTVAAATVYVAEWIHTGGNISLCINSGTDLTVASGDTSTMGVNPRLGRAEAFRLDGVIFEGMFSATIPSAGQRTAVVANMLAHIG